MRATRKDEQGQTLPLVLLVACFAGVVAIGLGRLSTEAVIVAQAQTAADAAALAAASHGRVAASAAAAANGARIVVYEPDGAEVEVVIERKGAQAVARARREGSTRRGQG